MTYDLHDPVGTYLRAWAFAMAHSGSRAGQGMVLGLAIATVAAIGLAFLILWFIANAASGGRVVEARVARDPNAQRRDPINWLCFAVIVAIAVGLAAGVRP